MSTFIILFLTAICCHLWEQLNASDKEIADLLEKSKEAPQPDAACNKLPQRVYGGMHRTR